MAHPRSFLRVRPSVIASGLLSLAFISLALVGCGSPLEQNTALSTPVDQSTSTIKTMPTTNPKQNPTSNSIVVNIVEQPIGQERTIAFVPASVAVLPGTTVVWNNTTGVDQTLVSPTDGVFSTNSKVMKNGSLKMAFKTNESITYSTKEHPEVKATLQVQPSASAVAVRLTNRAGGSGANANYVLTPAGMVIKVGTAVTWNNETDQNQVLASDKTNVFTAASTVAKKGSYKMVFSAPGTYTYYSKTSPATRGVIVVVP
jgi:plastocyanin